MIRMEFVDEDRCADILSIDRSDISEDWVDRLADILALHQYGCEHGCIGHTWAVYVQEKCIGVILMGEGFPWPCDPPDVEGIPFYRIMGFVIDKAWRSCGVGAQVLETAITRVFAEFGPRPILIGVQVDNHRAADFYKRHSFVPTDAMDEDDRFYIRWPAPSSAG